MVADFSSPLTIGVRDAAGASGTATGRRDGGWGGWGGDVAARSDPNAPVTAVGATRWLTLDGRPDRSDRTGRGPLRRV